MTTQNTYEVVMDFLFQKMLISSPFICASGTRQHSSLAHFLRSAINLVLFLQTAHPGSELSLCQGREKTKQRLIGCQSGLQPHFNPTDSTQGAMATRTAANSQAVVNNFSCFQHLSSGCSLK